MGDQHLHPLQIYQVFVTEFTCLLAYSRVGKVNKKEGPEAYTGWVRSEGVTLRSRHFNIPFFSLSYMLLNAYDRDYKLSLFGVFFLWRQGQRMENDHGLSKGLLKSVAFGGPVHLLLGVFICRTSDHTPVLGSHELRGTVKQGKENALPVQSTQ